MENEIFFKIPKNHCFYKDYLSYYTKRTYRDNQILNFLKQYNIESRKYNLEVKGEINVPYKKTSQTRINFSILPTINDLNNFNDITKPFSKNFRRFTHNSIFQKDIENFCEKKNIVINLCCPTLNNYIKIFNNLIYSYNLCIYKKDIYIQLHSNQLKDKYKKFITKNFDRISRENFFEIQNKK